MNISKIAQFIKLPTKKGCKANLVKSNQLPTETQYKLIPRNNNNSFEIPIGIDQDYYTILDLSKEPNILLTGMPGSGKTVTTMSALTYLGCMYNEDEIDIYISDLKRVSLNIFEQMKNIKQYAKTTTDTEVMIDEICNIVKERQDILIESKTNNINEYNDKYPQSKMKYIFVAIEELSLYTNSRDLTNQKDKLNILLDNAKMCGLCVWSTMANSNIDNSLKTRFDKIIAFKTIKSENIIITNPDTQKAIKNLNGNGHGYILSSSGEHTEFQAFYINNDTAKKILEEKNMLKK